MGKLIEQESILSQALKLFVTDILKLDDYSKLKKECLVNFKCLKRELNDIDVKLKAIDKQSQLVGRSFVNILQGFSNLDTADKKHFVNLIPPLKVDFQTGDISLGLHSGLSKILSTKRQAK